jgi:hypothetical protein
MEVRPLSDNERVIVAVSGLAGAGLAYAFQRAIFPHIITFGACAGLLGGLGVGRFQNPKSETGGITSALTVGPATTLLAYQFKTTLPNMLPIAAAAISTIAGTGVGYHIVHIGRYLRGEYAAAGMPSTQQIFAQATADANAAFTKASVTVSDMASPVTNALDDAVSGVASWLKPAQKAIGLA